MSGCGVRGDALRVARDPERSNSRPLRSGAAGGNRFYISLRRRQFPGLDSAYPVEKPGRDLPAQRRRAGANENLVPQRDRGGNRRGHCTSCAAGQGRAVKLLIYSHSFAPRLGDRKSTRLNSSHLVISYAVSLDRKSTRLNSSHHVISYAVFCLKKKKAATRLQQIRYGVLTPWHRRASRRSHVACPPQRVSHVSI